MMVWFLHDFFLFQGFFLRFQPLIFQGFNMDPENWWLGDGLMTLMTVPEIGERSQNRKFGDILFIPE